jgi:SAM-dependent methyltransferase
MTRLALLMGARTADRLDIEGNPMAARMKKAVAILRKLRIAAGSLLNRMRPSRMHRAFPGGDRRLYQEKLFPFSIPAGARVLDIGSGPVPFHRATVLCERFLGPTGHRRGDVRTGGLPMVVADIHQLPFRDQAFDFVYCAHVLEHVVDPVLACREMMRIGRRGYLETPNFMKDTLFCQAELVEHRWHTVAAGKSLFFFEYTERERRGICSGAWHDIIWSRFRHPLQEAFIENQDLFNTMFSWEGPFAVHAVDHAGHMQSALPGEAEG